MVNQESNDPVAMYIREVGKVDPLSMEEEAELFRELGGAGEWDVQKENAERRLIESRLRQCRSI